jgi:type I restriction enzyme S subunit
MKYAAYSEYKTSGSNWLDAVPSHWNVKPLKLIVKMPITDGPHETPEFTPDGVPFASVEAVWDGKVHLSSVRGYISEEDHRRYGKKYHPKRGDIFIVKSGSTTGKIAIVDFDDDFNVWSPLAAVRCDASQAHPEFVFYALSSSYFQRLVQVSWSFGTQPNIGMGVLGNLPAVLPPPAEQQTIARFLDAKTAQIDALVAQKRQLIDKLKEKRQALIARTVTRGLPPEAAKAAGLEPNPEMKDSGADWLGAVPARWKIKAIKWATPVQRGASPRPIDDPSYFDDDGEYAWVRISDVTAAGMYLDATEQRLSDLGSSLSVKMQPGSLFLSIAGTVGKPCIANIKCCIHDGFVYFPRWKGDSRFLFYVFASGEPYKGLGKMGTQLNLNTDTVGSIVIGIPDAPEQRLIADYLDRTTAELDSMTTAVEAAIDRLVEYRQAVITSAVTGKIDVRELA